jgi:putative FmdB family regulatory protein
MPLYDYFCSSCNSTWDEFHSIANRKTPEILPCPKCNLIGTKQTIVHTALPISHVSENSNALKKLNNSKFAEKMNMIHQNTPGSQMNKSSTVVNVK